LLVTSYVLPGQIRYTLKLAKDEPAEFLDVLKGGPFIAATLSAGLVMFFIWLMPILPWVFHDIVVLAFAFSGASTVPGPIYVPLLLLTFFTSVLLFGMSVRMLLQRSLFSYVIVDLRSSGADGVEISSSLLSGSMGPMFLVYLAVFGTMLAGLATCGIGLLFAVPFCQLLVSVAFADITGAIPRVDNDD
jgi:hypothetical protein